MFISAFMVRFSQVGEILQANCVSMTTQQLLGYRLYGVQRKSRQPLLDWMEAALTTSGCNVLYSSEADVAPFRIVFETPEGERIGIVAYAFLANSKPTKNRPQNEHRLQVKYGNKAALAGLPQDIWQDPCGLYTTLLLGINPDQGFFVGYDPVLHSPTKFFISLEFNQENVDEILDQRWAAWERVKRRGDWLFEAVVGGTQASFLRYIRFEREAFAEDQGHRLLLAERSPQTSLYLPNSGGPTVVPAPARLHALAEEFQLEPEEILSLISRAPRLKMAVRGWVAEEHLARKLREVPGVTDCKRIEGEGQPDVELRFRDGPLISVECKNVSRKTTAAGLVKVDFQRTRASKSDPSSRYYSPSDFDVVAACLHSVTEEWSFKYVNPERLDVHPKFSHKIWNNVKLDDRWSENVEDVLSAVNVRKSC